MRLTLIICLSFAAMLTACANPGISKLSPDTYILSRTDKGGIFGNPSAMKADVLREANEFAESQGKVAIPIGLRETPLLVGRQFASVEYQFRVVEKSDPEAKRTSLVPRPDVVIERTEKVTADITTKDRTESKKDVYAELIKLDDLRKRGILSESEFQAQKQKVLEGK
jgi:Short C-terminal domain